LEPAEKKHGVAELASARLILALRLSARLSILVLLKHLLLILLALRRFLSLGPVADLSFDRKHSRDADSASDDEVVCAERHAVPLR